MGLIIETEKGKKKYISEGTPREKKYFLYHINLIFKLIISHNVERNRQGMR